ncbi:MAG TPA: PH domain-containing protein [Acidobacteriota bacterium]|nr:PH domain-containing protein [Acidobacteriota bacterium]
MGNSLEGPSAGEPASRAVAQAEHQSGPTVACEEQEAEAAGSTTGAWRNLDPRVVPYWRLKGMARWLTILAVAGGVGLLLPARTSVPSSLVLILWTVLLVFAAFDVFWLPPRRFGAFQYRLGEGFFELCYGIFWRVGVMIPIRRIQHVDLRESPWERRFGLARIEIFTAGTRNASHELPGLARETASQLRQDLVTAADQDAV